MASMGASALLVFVLPSSPMAQHWAVIGRNVISALMGITCVHLLGEQMLTPPVAVGLAILCMFVLRCLHPPAAAITYTLSFRCWLTRCCWFSQTS